ncbi:hypothetical protein KC316_g14394 [Hortaea werneckii]|nr:hypothetical protein KC316_g14394 [Hortaea werneckii]
MAVSRHHAALTRPLSISEIVAQAQDFEFTTQRALQQWLKAAKMLLTEAAICEQDGNIQMAYLYLYRHAELVLDKLPKHPDYKDPSARDEMAQARKALQKNLRKLEDWKPRIESEFSKYAKALEKREAERQRVVEERQKDEREGIRPAEGASRKRQSDDGILGDGSQIINATENSQLAVDLARREIRRRDANKQTTRRAVTLQNPDTIKLMGLEKWVASFMVTNVEKASPIKRPDREVATDMHTTIPLCQTESTPWTGTRRLCNQLRLCRK